jgi:hypothetical protein
MQYQQGCSIHNSKFKSQVDKLVFAHRYNYFRREPFLSKQWQPGVSIYKLKRTSIIGSRSKVCVTFIGLEFIVADSAIRGKQQRRHKFRRSV